MAVQKDNPHDRSQRLAIATRLQRRGSQHTTPGWLALARRIVRLLAKVLELPENYFDPVVTHPGAMLRLLKYPAQDPSQPDALGIGAHTDIECFTILCQGTQPALQILNVNGEWIEAPPIPGTFVVNIGDMLARVVERCVHFDRAQSAQCYRRGTILGSVLLWSELRRYGRTATDLCSG